MNPKELFNQLYFAQTEDEIDQIIFDKPEVFKEENWSPFGHDINYFGIIETQQAAPIPALVEKITNSIDAILMKQCHLENIKPDGPEAPKSMEKAVKKFFPNWDYWNLRSKQREQAEKIQIIADGPKRETSLIIYDDGEGQHPDAFEDTFLSLLKGNKVKIHFVQGKYNMGGSGALVFCGKKRYQLIGSKRYDKTGGFGFTLVRRHQLSKKERDENPRFLHYEYLTIEGEIPRFDIERMDLGLYNRPFETGTIIKLFNYRMPGITDISRDLNLSLNEFLFEPALPLFTIEDTSKKYRYPNTPQPQRELYGLKRRLEKQKETYLDWEDCFDEEYKIPERGSVKVYVYVFKARLNDKNTKESIKTIRREFFQNNMSVLFSLNGQVHGHYTSEFITHQLKFRLLKDYLIIHVDCSGLYPEFRNELFMASRDRLKEGDETKYLREFLGDKLRKSKLKEIFKRRKNTLALGEGETSEVFRSIAKNISLNPEMMKLLQQAFKLDQKQIPPKKDNQQTKVKTEKKEEKPFKPQRFPSYFKAKGAEKDGKTIVRIPQDGERSVRYESDVENSYFKRAEEPGDLEIALLKFLPNQEEGGTKPGIPKDPDEIMAVSRSSPENGEIKITFSPTQDVNVGDAFEMQVTLKNSGGEDFIRYILVKIVDPDKPKQKVDKPVEEEPLGLPLYILAYEKLNSQEDQQSDLVKESTIKTWHELGDSGVPIDHDTIIHPEIDEEDKLESIVINMNSTVLMNYKKSLSGQDQLLNADKRYITAVYFHSLILYASTKQRGYEFTQKDENGNTKDVDLTEYLKDVFAGQYSTFLLNFGLDELMAVLD